MATAGEAPALDTVSGAYRLHFARTESDLEAVQRLRYRVFNVELGEGLDEAHATGLDADPFDAQCQHVIVSLAATGEAVGTYRMQAAEHAAAGRGWYAASEFDLTSLPEERLARAAELGRACIAVEHRDRIVLNLLWRGLFSFLARHCAESFFGCSSITSTDPRDGADLYAKLAAEGHVDATLRVEPRASHACTTAELAAPDEARRDVAVPKLFAIYLRQGAKVLGPPALDAEFGTIDFLTWVTVTPELRRRYAER